MASTYSPSLGIELIGNGEQAGTWGTTTNNNLGTLIEQAIAGVQPITLTGNYTLTDFNGLPDESRNAVLVFNGTLGAPCNVVAPSVEKVYVVRNVSGNTVTVKTSSGNGVALINAASAVIFCDGTDFYSATTLNYIDGNLTVTGTATIGGALTANSTITANSSVTIKGDVFANSNTGQMYIPVGTTGQRTGSPINGVFRYNSTLNVYEGYADGEWVNFQTYAQASYTATYLVAAGGGGGGQNSNPDNGSGGGGAGGLIQSTTTFTPGTVYSIIVGAGGAGGGSATNGQNSAITGIATAIGGGAAGGNGNSGGSGGGAANDGGLGGAGTGGQGNRGGNNFFRGGGNYTATGGGGAGAAGGDTTDYFNGSSGGVGLTSTLLGATNYYCGGGGAHGQASNGVGGTGGGGNPNGGSGGANTGGGGGGYGGNGGSGVIILSVPTVNYSGTYTGNPTVTTVGGNTVMQFNNSGTYTA